VNFADCLKQGLVKKDQSAPSNVNNSFEVAERFLNSAKSNFNIKDYEMTEIAAYNSAFHSARALLFAKGHRERSHYCLAVAVRHLYRDSQKAADFINRFDELRLSRHNVQYGGTRITGDEAEYVLGFAEEFLIFVKTLLNNNGKGQK
jgi:uncharacterized protein (UPF0332 family)